MQIPGLEIRLDAVDVPWQATSAPGVGWFLLASEASAQTGAARGGTVLIRMEPGRGYPPHRHLDVEEVLVLQGGYRDAEGIHRAGDYVRYPAGSTHAPVALGDPDAPQGEGNLACVLFATARGGIEVLDDDPGRS